MKRTILEIAIRTAVVLILVIVLAALVYFAQGGKTSRGLSDTLVYASFLTLTAGTLIGISRIGFKGALSSEIPDDEQFQWLVRTFFRAGPLGIAVTLAGVFIFLAAMIVDGLF
jgi:hypothetical protein